MAKEKKAEDKQAEVEEKKETKAEEKAESSVPAIKKEGKKSDIVVEKIELDREYVIPLRRGFLKVSRHRRAKKAVRIIKEFLAKHMRVEDRDVRKVKIDQYLNEEVWFRGIKKPASRIKVKAIKKDGIVYASLFELPDNMKFAKARRERQALGVVDTKHEHTHEEKKEETVEQKKDEKEKEVSSVEAGKKRNKDEAKATKHSTDSEHEHKTYPRRQSLKK